jgi:hypothetical protein
MLANVLRYPPLRRVAAALALWALGGCGAETPPYEELPLRDALNAAPEVLAALPERTRRDVALRLEEAQGAEGEETPLASAEIPTMPALVRSADALREDEDRDAIVLGALEPSSQGFVLRSLAAGDGSFDAGFDVSALEGQPAATTAQLEEIALRGRAGAILADLARRSEAREIVRVTGVPAGAVALNRTVYVNGSWLVALSALEPKDAPARRPPSGVGVLLAAPRLEPKSVRANPYKLPASVAECATDVRDVCSCAASSQCDHEPTDHAFASGQLECEWVNADAARAEALCVLALMSIDGVKECVQSAGAACTKVPVASRDDAVSFVADAGCLDVLDQCLQYGKPTAPASRGGSSCDGCGGCGSSSSNETSTSNDGCSKTCSDCSQNCSECNQNCSECNQNCKDCNDNCKRSPSNNASGPATCRLSAGRRVQVGGRSGAPAPAGPALWLFAPVGYILRRIRRRS